MGYRPWDCEESDMTELLSTHYWGFPRSSVSKESACNAGPGFHPWVGHISWRRKWQPAPVFLPGKSHGQKSLAGYHPRGLKRVGPDLATKQQMWVI